MKKTLKNLAAIVITAGTLIATGCGDGKKLQNEHLLPEVAENQKLVLDSNYVNGSIPLGYTLLTDIDNDGSWDIARSVYARSGPGSMSIIESYKEGYEGKHLEDFQSTYQTHFVRPEFFEKYQ